MANLPSEGELVQQRDFYNLAADALLANGTFRSDGHYLYGPVDIVDVQSDSDELQEGRFKLTDYYSGEMAGYDADFPDNARYQRALLTGRGILLFTFTDNNQQEYPFSYTACFPSYVNPYSTIGLYFYPENHGVHPETREPLSTPAVPEWHEDEPAIIRSDPAADKLVVDLMGDLQLQKLMEAMRTV